MATKSANRSNLLTRTAHWLTPSREHLALTIVAEIWLGAAGLPLGPHLMLVALLQLLQAGAPVTIDALAKIAPRGQAGSPAHVALLSYDRRVDIDLNAVARNRGESANGS